MIAIADTNTFIKREIDQSKYSAIYVPTLVNKEILDTNTREYYSSIYNIEVRDPLLEHIQVAARVAEANNLLLSRPDIHVLALFIELQQQFNVWLSKDDGIECLTKDNGILEALTILGFAGGVREKKWVFRCFTCFAVYDKSTEFCRCGYNTVTRVSCRVEEGETVLNLKKGYKYKSKELLGKNGKRITSPDQKEYTQMIREQRKEEKKLNKMMEFF